MVRETRKELSDRTEFFLYRSFCLVFILSLTLCKYNSHITDYGTFMLRSPTVTTAQLLCKIVFQCSLSVILPIIYNILLTQPLLVKSVCFPYPHYPVALVEM